MYCKSLWIKQLLNAYLPINLFAFNQLEQAVEKESAWFRDTSLALEELRAINLNPDVIASQLNEQKVSFCTFTKIFSVHILEMLYNSSK